MRRPYAAGGIALFVVAAALFGVALLAEFPAGSHTTTAGTAWKISSSTTYAVSVTISWVGGVNATHAYLVDATPDCASVTGVVASGTGMQGSFRAVLEPGKQYELLACDGASWQPVTFTLSAQRVLLYTVPFLAGGAAAVIAGVTVLVLGTRPPRYIAPRPPRRYYPHR